MKIIRLYFTLIAISALALNGCEDFLTEEHPSEVTTDFLYNTADGLRNAVTGLYAIERDQVDDQESTYFSLAQGDGGTDLDFIRAAVSSNLARYRTDVDLTTEAAPRSWWRKWYTIIERANSIIEYGSKADIPENEKKIFLREAYIHRANAYFWLLRRFDNIWLNLEPTTYENITNREFAPADQSEVYNLIVSDLDYAINAFNGNYNALPGTYGLGAALFLRIDVALWMKDYDKAGFLAEKLINEGPYQLVEPSAIFTKDGRNSTKETIYALQLDEFAMGGGNAHRLPLTFTTQYRSVPGMIKVSEFGGYGWARIAPNEYLTSLYDEKYDKRYNAYWQHYYTYNDPDYNFSGTKFKYGDTLKAGQQSMLTSTNFYTNASVSCRKYWDWNKDPDVRISYNNIIVYRFAEVYLMAAEAFLKSSTPNSSKARYYINILRMSRINSGAPNRILISVTEEDILEEHARELAFEGRRWFMLKRTNKLVERVRLHAGQSSFRGVPSPSPDYFAARTNIQDYHVRWPIPQSEIDAMGGKFPQNEGYKK